MFNALQRGLIAASFLISSAFSTGAFAHDYVLGDLTINHAHARATVKGAPVSGGYLTITNSGESDDRLIGASAEFSTKAEIHEMAMEGDVMKMRAVEGGVLIPAGETVILKSGGMHIMFMGLKEQLKPEEKRRARLEFEAAGTIDIEFSIETTMSIMKNAKAASKKMKMVDHSTHKKMKEQAQ